MPLTRKYPLVQFRGRGLKGWQYYYHKILQIPLWQFIVLITLAFICINFVFTLLYHFTRTLSGAGHVSFLDAFYFSVVTFTTLGYGDITAVSIGRLFAGIEVFIGLLFIGTLTGLIFARFSRTPSPLVWSSPVVLFEENGKKHIQVRVTNIIGNDVVNVIPQLMVQKTKYNKSGEIIRELVPVKLETDYIPIAAFSWILSHSIDNKSPLKLWAEGKAPENERLIGFITGFDSSVGKDIYSHARWRPQDIVKGIFVNIIAKYSESSDQRIHVEMDLSKLDDVIKE